MGGRESDGHAPPRKLTRTEEDASEDDSAPDFSFSQMQAHSQDEAEAEQRTKEMSLVSLICWGVVTENVYAGGSAW